MRIGNLSNITKAYGIKTKYITVWWSPHWFWCPVTKTWPGIAFNLGYVNIAIKWRF